jgi:hypothetical protein
MGPPRSVAYARRLPERRRHPQRASPWLWPCRCHVDYDVDKLYFRPMSRCLGGRPAHAPLMAYEQQYLANYAGTPRLSWSVYLEGHEVRARCPTPPPPLAAPHSPSTRCPAPLPTFCRTRDEGGPMYPPPSCRTPARRAAAHTHVHVHAHTTC